MDEINAEIINYILESESDFSDTSSEENYNEIVPEPHVLFAANNGKKR